MLLMSIFHPYHQKSCDVSVHSAQFCFPGLLPLFQRLSCSFLRFALTDGITGGHHFPGSSVVLLKRPAALFQYVSSSRTQFPGSWLPYQQEFSVSTFPLSKLFGCLHHKVILVLVVTPNKKPK